MKKWTQRGEKINLPGGAADIVGKFTVSIPEASNRRTCFHIMSQVVPFAPKQIESMVVESVERVFNTMLYRTIRLKHFHGPETETSLPPIRFPVKGEKIMVSAVGFVGEFNGIYYLHQTEALAQQLAGGFLGMTPEEVAAEGAETLQDVLGELANMIGGTFKNKLCDFGFNCRLTIPSLVCGSDFAIEAPHGVERYMALFEVDNAPYLTDVMLKHSEA